MMKVGVVFLRHNIERESRLGVGPNRSAIESPDIFRGRNKLGQAVTTKTVDSMFKGFGERAPIGRDYRSATQHRFNVN